MLKTRGRNKIIVDGWKLEPFAGDKVYKFDCGDDDLNSFFKEDVREHDRDASSLLRVGKQCYCFRTRP
ncbi:MAG: hypothetical protein WCJ75_05145, partial [Desulfomonile sp.]